jgi:phosphoglycolate phosphatase-like HAD superfamily hydrolase
VLVLFDIDGTLIGGDGAGRRAFERACLEVLGVAGALTGLRLDGMTDPLILDHVYATHLGRAPHAGEPEAVLASYVTHLAPELERSRCQVHPGVCELLERLEARAATIGLATGNLRDGARLKLTAASRTLGHAPAGGDLWGRFPFGGFGSDARDRAELVRVAIARGSERAGRAFAAEETFVVGDTPRDVAAAHAAGARAIGVATGAFSVDALDDCGADLAVPTLHDWLATLD